ncbi:Cysteine-rich protein 2-binding protein [Haplosporangium sp. Z 27]|nr:Cysteine-rich protein 2-binding protein [Haplosporangium sp. Z 27]
MAAQASPSSGKSVTEFPYEIYIGPRTTKATKKAFIAIAGETKSSCVSSLSKPLLKGDEFFKFECSVCTQGPEFFERAALSWVILVHLVLYNLMDAHPDQQYFRWKEEICKFIDDYWSYLLPDKEQSPTWNNTVASVLSVQNHIFRSGMEIKGASGWWTLFEKAPPDRNRKLKSKNKSSQKSGNPRNPSSKSREKRARAKGSPSRKKTKFDETSSDDDFHTSAKPRPQSSAPTTRIKSRQFSLSSGSSLSSAGDSDDSLDDDDIFWKSDEEKEFRPEVHLHGIPACIQHHFNPSGLDFSGGPIHLEEIFRLTDLLDENSPGKLIHRVNNLGAMSAGGKKKRRKSSVSEYKMETSRNTMDDMHYSQDISDITDEDIDNSTDGSELDSNQGSDSDDLHQAQARVKHTGGKRFNHMVTPGNSSSAPPMTGGKHGRRKSSLKDIIKPPRKPKKNVSMADEIDVSYLPSSSSMFTGTGGGKKFSQAHIDAMTKAMMSSSKPESKPKARTKPKPKAASPIDVGPEPSLESLSLAETTPNAPPTLSLEQIQMQQEWHILQVLEDASKSKALPTIAARYKRKLHLKRLKSFLHLPLFNMEEYMRQHLASPLDLTRLSKHIPTDPYELRRLQEEEFRAKIQKIDHTPYGNSFASRLLGQPVDCLTRKPWEPLWKSPFSGKILNDFIWRDYESRSVMMDVLDEVKTRQGRPAKVRGANLGLEALRARGSKKRRREGVYSGYNQMDVDQHQDQLNSRESSGPDRPHQAQNRSPIDYCYFRKEHLAQVNETLCRRFWPGIDMTEALQYPEYSVIVLYKRLVVGCAFMTPEGYITYVAVSAGWEKAGIGQFMLYHLIQASNGKDITLHVSANNPAMIMYQKFGFKPEQFLNNFYKEYLPENSVMCHNAFFVRLRR